MGLPTIAPEVVSIGQLGGVTYIHRLGYQQSLSLNKSANINLNFTRLFDVLHTLKPSRYINTNLGGRRVKEVCKWVG